MLVLRRGVWVWGVSGMREAEFGWGRKKKKTQYIQKTHKHYSDGPCGTIVPRTNPHPSQGQTGQRGDFTGEFNRKRPVCPRDRSQFVLGRCPLCPRNNSLGNGRNTVSRVLFRRRELTEFYGKLGEFCEKLGEFALAHK